MQPYTGGEWTRVQGTAAGTTTISNKPCVLERIIITKDAEGTVTLYDSASGTTGASEMFELVDDAAATGYSFPVTLQPDVRCRNGLICVHGGTVDVVFVTRR